MNKEGFQNIKVSVVSIILLTVLFIAVQSVAIASGPVPGGLVKGRDVDVNKFQLSPTPSNPGYKSSLDSSTYFRVYGDSIFADAVINEDASFRGNAEQDDDLVETPNGIFNVGYTAFTGPDGPPDLAQFQVNGDIRVLDLQSSTQAGVYCLCANGYGELERCGVYDPANGHTC
ncbi:hypothetical protein [Croceimicrobium sp.]|uniref:hypothetical protein n=1 Tax=Croceimicrobium sp. TaxID=2828340 RepID=UPI003BABBAA0